MTNTQLSGYLGMKPSQVRKTFDSVRDAFEEVGLSRDISLSLADLFQYGSIPANYDHYLKELDAVHLLVEEGGMKVRHAEMIVKSRFYDPWVMLKAAANKSIDMPLPAEFEALVLDAADKRIALIRDSKTEKEAALAKARKTIDALVSPLKIAERELSTLEPWTLAGTQPGDIQGRVTKILELLGEAD